MSERADLDAGLDEIEGLAILDAIGALEMDAPECARLTAAMAAADVTSKSSFAAIYEAAVALALADTPPIAPPPSVKASLLSRLEPAAPVPDLLRFVTTDQPWQPHPVPGIEIKILSIEADRGYVTLLMRLAAGTRYPDHNHTGPEECYVIDGDAFVGGQWLGPGDFHHASPGSEHLDSRTEKGCTLLLVVAASDFFR